ncbi:hypothetical protein [Amycolatopsis sp. lyj-90]|uniref:hypothetical protein n=1 Tax=Amycolatopsis sp. lyj-90 TaxID=2789285 RepID=UPI00397900D7
MRARGEALRAGHPERAKDLLDAARRLREATGAPLPPGECGDVDRIQAALNLLEDPAGGTLGRS